MKKKTRLGEKAACCGANTAQCCPTEDAGKKPLSTDSAVTWKDRIDHFRCRIGAYRMKYVVVPGLYALGSPGPGSDVFVTANYKMSFDILRGSIPGVDAWLLVLDTKGINVWCAAGKGTFGTDELVKKVFSERLHEKVSHRRLILPQLGAPGVSAPEVRKQTGFRAIYGPVLASDLKEFVSSGYKASAGMRLVQFSLKDRLVLTPMELRPALKIFAIFSLLLFALSGLTTRGISFEAAIGYGGPLIILGLVSVLAGALLTPALLPFIPFRPFAIKGWLAGLASVLVASFFIPAPESVLLKAASLLFFPLASSYMALQFTGSTTFTGASGVNKELKFSIPVYLAGTGMAFLLFIAFKISQWGLL